MAHTREQLDRLEDLHLEYRAALEEFEMDFPQEGPEREKALAPLANEYEFAAILLVRTEIRNRRLAALAATG